MAVYFNLARKKFISDAVVVNGRLYCCYLRNVVYICYSKHYRLVKLQKW